MNSPEKSARRGRAPKVVRALAVGALGFGLTFGAAPALADATFPSPKGNGSLAAIKFSADTVKELKKIERSSKGVKVSTLAELGIPNATSERGQDLYVATVGTGENHVWVQGRIHGNEPFGTDTALELLKTLGSNGSPTSKALRDHYTFHIIPMYNPDGADDNLRHTTLASNQRRVDLNRDWVAGGFQAKESLAWYHYWTQVDPMFALDIHHQGLKREHGTDDPVSMSLGISLAPGGPTLPNIADGAYDVLTRQAMVHVYDEVSKFGFTNVDRYQVGGSLEIDIHGGVASAMMLGLDYNGLNPEGHSHPTVFLETSGNTSPGSIGQKARGKLIKQNVEATRALFTGLMDGTVQNLDPERWEDIPHAPTTGYQTDHSGIIRK